MSFEEFVDKLRTDVRVDVAKSNEKVEGELPELLGLRPSNRQRSLLLDPKGAQKDLRGLIVKDGKRERFLDVVSAVRGESVEITQVMKGQREDERDFILRGRNPQTGIDVDDLRVLVGIAARKGQDSLNEVTQAAFFKKLKLHTYRGKASLESD